MTMWWSDTLPTVGTWCWANGGTLPRTGLGAAVFALWGTAYGAGDGSTTFNVPNMQEVVPVGKSTMGSASSPGLLPSIASGVKGVLNGLFGSDTVSLSAANIPTLSVSGSASGSMSGATTVNVDQGLGSSTTGGGGFAFNYVIAQATAAVSVSGTLGVTGAYTNGSPSAVANTQPSRAVNFIIRIA
jgi:microcystin-dependent protein